MGQSLTIHCPCNTVIYFAFVLTFALEILRNYGSQYGNYGGNYGPGSYGNYGVNSGPGNYGGYGTYG